MDSFLDKVNLFMNTVAGYANMSVEEKDEFVSEYVQGLLINLLTDGQNLVSVDTLESVKTAVQTENLSQENLESTLQKYLMELRAVENGEEIINRRLREMVENIIDSVKEVLTESQKDELLGILV